MIDRSIIQINLEKKILSVPISQDSVDVILERFSEGESFNINKS